MCLDVVIVSVLCCVLHCGSGGVLYHIVCICCVVGLYCFYCAVLCCHVTSLECEKTSVYFCCVVLCCVVTFVVLCDICWVGLYWFSLYCVVLCCRVTPLSVKPHHFGPTCCRRSRVDDSAEISLIAFRIFINGFSSSLSNTGNNSVECGLID